MDRKPKYKRICRKCYIEDALGRKKFKPMVWNDGIWVCESCNTYVHSKLKRCAKDNIIDDGQVADLLNVANPEQRMLFSILLYTGLRRAELFHLNLRWVDFEKKLITIPRREECDCYDCDKRGGWWETKTDEGARIVPILPESNEYLRDFFDVHTSFKRYKYPQILERKIRALGKRAGIHIFPHCLRATFATMLARKGYSAHEIKVILGWKNIDEAQSYVDLTSEDVANKIRSNW